MSADLHSEGDPRSFAGFVLLIGLAFVVLLVVYVYVGQLSTATPRTPPGEVAESTAGGVKPGPLPTQPDAEARIAVFQDQRSHFRMELLDTWSEAVVGVSGEDGSASGGGNAGLAGPGAQPARAGTSAADPASTDTSGYDVVFFMEDTDERLAVMVRYDPSHEALEQWVERLAPGTSPVDGRPLANAIIAGQPARIVWRDESPTSPAMYAALLAHGDRVYVITYSAANGGAMIQEFLRALVTFELAATESEDTIPPIPQPSSRYYPHTALLEGSPAHAPVTPGDG